MYQASFSSKLTNAIVMVYLCIVTNACGKQSKPCYIGPGKHYIRRFNNHHSASSQRQPNEATNNHYHQNSKKRSRGQDSHEPPSKRRREDKRKIGNTKNKAYYTDSASRQLQPNKPTNRGDHYHQNSKNTSQIGAYICSGKHHTHYRLNNKQPNKPTNRPYLPYRYHQNSSNIGTYVDARKHYTHYPLNNKDSASSQRQPNEATNNHYYQNSKKRSRGQDSHEPPSKRSKADESEIANIKYKAYDMVQRRNGKGLSLWVNSLKKKN